MRKLAGGQRDDDVTTSHLLTGVFNLRFFLYRRLIHLFTSLKLQLIFFYSECVLFISLLLSNVKYFHADFQINISYRLLSQLVVQIFQAFGCIVKFPFCLLKMKNVRSFFITSEIQLTQTSWMQRQNASETYRVSCCELAALHQAVEGGFEDQVFSGDLFLLHPLCRQLLKELKKTSAPIHDLGMFIT